MTKMLEDLATIIALDGPKGNYSVACTAALGYFRTHHAEIAQNAEAVARCTALYKEWVTKAAKSSEDNSRTQAANLWEHSEQLKEALR